MKLRFLCVGGFTCSVRSTLWNVKHEPLRGVWGHALPENFWKMHALRLNLVLSEAQNCYAKDRLWKSDVREISLTVHANPSPRSSWKLRFKKSDSCASSVIFASCLFPQLPKSIKQSLFSFTGLVLVLLPLSCAHTWWQCYKIIFLHASYNKVMQSCDVSVFLRLEKWYCRD